MDGEPLINKALLAEYEKYAQELEAEYVFVYLKFKCKKSFTIFSR